MPGPKKPKIDNAYVSPTPNNGVQGGVNFSSVLGNSQINGMADANSFNYSLGQNYTYPINKNLNLQGGVNYNAFNYGGYKGNNVSGNIGANYSGPIGKNTDIDITSSLNLDKEGLSPNFQLGLRKRFGEGGTYTDDSNIANLPANKLSRFFYNEEELEGLQTRAEECYVDADGNKKGCAQGAFDMNINEVAPHLGLKGIREIQQNAIGPDGMAKSPYSIKSKNRDDKYADAKNKIEFMHNNSIDSWELYKMYKQDPNVGSVLWSYDNDGAFGNRVDNKEWQGKIPLGAIITQGNTRGGRRGHLTAPEHYGKSSHTTTVVGFAEDGTPLVYDDGKVAKLGNSTYPGLYIKDIYVPKGYGDFTYGNMKNRVKEYNQGLGYRDDNDNAITDKPNQYSRSYINDVKNALDENEQAIGQNYGISKSVMDKIQNRVIGIGAQESNLNNFGDIKEKNPRGEFKDHDSSTQRYLDNPLANSVLKPVGKFIGDAISVVGDNTILDMLYDKEEKSDWVVEILTEDKLDEEGIAFKYGDDTWRKAYNEMRGQYSQPKMAPEDLLEKDYASSRGPFKIKSFPKSATKLLKDKNGEPLTEGDLNLVGGDVDELRYGANVAAIHISENYNRMKKRYNTEKDFNLTDDQLIDLASVAYNNNKKSLSDDFVKRFIQSDTLKDGYLTNIKRYEKLYLEQEELQPGESTEDGEVIENSPMSAEDLEMLKKNAAAAEQLMAQPPAQQAYGGPIAFANGGTIKNNTMNNQNFMNAMQMMQRQNMQRQQMANGGLSNFGAGFTGALQGVGGSLPGPLGDMAVQGIGAVHGMIDKDITDEDRAIMGGARAVGAGATAIATGGATLAAGADDMVVGTKDAVKHGTEWGQDNAAALDTIGNIAGIAAGGAAGGAASGEGAMKGMGQAFGMPGGANAGGTPGINGGQGGFNPQQLMGMAQQFGLMGYGGPLMMAQGGEFSPHPMYKDGQMIMANDHATHLSLKEQGYGHEQMKNGGMIKRADGSYSKRGLWDNIRANAGSGKKPTKQMLAQEKKIKKMAEGGLMSIENGGTHEQNPMGGVPVGPNASVEEGETIMDLVEGGKFVFSDRKGPKGKKGQTWSDISKRVERKYKDREGDAAAKRAMDQELLGVAEEQEAQKAKEMAKLQAKMNDLSGQAPAGMEGMSQAGMMPPQGEMAPPPQMGMPDPGMMQQLQQGMPLGMPPQMGMGGPYYGLGGVLNPQRTSKTYYPEMDGYLKSVAKQNRDFQHPLSVPPNKGTGFHMMPDGTMMPGATHGGFMGTAPYGYGGTVKKYGYGGSLNIPQEDIDYIEQMIDFELAHGSADGTGLGYGAWSDNNASDRDSAIEFIYDKYVTPNKDLPVELRKRAADMHLNSEDPRASLMVAAGVITPAEKLKLYNVKNPKTGKGMINPDDLDKLWEKNKDKVEDKYSDPKFVEDFDKEKHRSYSGLGDMYKNSQKYRIDMWNPQAANYRNPSNYKNTDYDGGQPTVGSAQFGTKQQDTKSALNRALNSTTGNDVNNQVFTDGNGNSVTANSSDGQEAYTAGSGSVLRPNGQTYDPATEFQVGADNITAPENPQYKDPLTGEAINYDPYSQENQQLDMAGNSAVPNQGNGADFLNESFDKTPYGNGTGVPKLGSPNLEMVNNSVGLPALETPSWQSDAYNLGNRQNQANNGAYDAFPTLNNGPVAANNNKSNGLGFADGTPLEQGQGINAYNEQQSNLQDGPYSSNPITDINSILNPPNPEVNTQSPFATPDQLRERNLNAQQPANDGKIYSTNTGEEIDMTQNDWQNQLTPEADAYQKQRNLDAYNKEVAQLDAEALAREQEAAEKKRVRNRNLGIGAGALANSIGDIHNLKRGLKGPEEIKYDRINSEQIDLHNQRLMMQNNAAGTIGNVREGMRRAGDISSMIAAQSAVGQQLGQGLAKSYLDENTTNTGIRNNDKIRNQAIDTAEQIANQKAKAASSLLVNEGLHGIGRNAAGALYDVRQSNQVDRTNEQQVGAMNSMFKDFNFEKLKDMYTLKYGNNKPDNSTKQNTKRDN